MASNKILTTERKDPASEADQPEVLTTMGTASHTPGPLFVRQPNEWLWPVQIVNAKGEVIFSEPRQAYSTTHKNVGEVLAAKDMAGRPECAEANQRQLADAYLRAGCAGASGVCAGVVKPPR